VRPYLAALSVIPLTLVLAACDSSQKPAATTTTVTAPAAPAATPATADAALEPLIGTWAATTGNCSTPITIAANSFKGYENSCEISGWTDNGDGTFTAAMSCTAEGKTADEKITMTPLFGPQGEGIRLAYDDRGGDPVTVFRCSRPKAQ
jgi:hypothetical protein